MTTLPFDIVVNDSKSKGKFKGLGDEAEGAGKKLEGAGKLSGLAVAAIGAAAIAAAPQVLGAAANIELLGNKSKTVFGSQIGVVDKWADANAAAMGLTSNEATGLAAGFADLLKPMGFTEKQATSMSTEMIGLSGALSEWTGGTKSATEVSDILSAAMLGERDALQSLGISISAAEVEAKLLANGQQDLTGKALQQAEAIATQQLILEKSTDAQKAYASGSGSLSRQLSETTAQVKEMGTELLEKATPALKAIVGVGGEVVGAVSNLGDTFGALPGPLQAVYGGLTAIAVGGPAAATGIGKARDLAAGAIEKFRGLGTAGKVAAIGVGAAGGALIVATAVLTYFAQEQADSKARVDALTDSLDQQTGAVTKTTRELRLQTLEEKGAAEEAEKLGISMKDLVDASLDPTGAAAKRVASRMAELDKQYRDGKPALDAFGGSWTEQVGVMEHVNNVLGDLNPELRLSRDELRRRKEAGVEATDVEGDLKDGVEETTGAVKEQIEPVKTLTEQWREAAGIYLDGRDAQRQLEQAIDDVNAAQEENGKTLDENTEKGRENAEKLDALAKAHMDVLESAEKEGASQRTLIGLRSQSVTALYNEARQFGLTKDQAIAYAGKVLGIPKKAVTEALLKKAEAEAQIKDLEAKLGKKGLTRNRRADLEAQLARARAVRAEIDRLTMPRNLLIYTYRVESSSRRRGRQYEADGGFISGMAEGGFTGQVVGPGSGISDEAGLFALSNGEYVVRAAAVKKYGVHVMEALNSMRIEPMRNGSGVRAGEPTSYPWMNKRSVGGGGNTHIAVQIGNTTVGEIILDPMKKLLRTNGDLKAVVKAAAA